MGKHEKAYEVLRAAQYRKPGQPRSARADPVIVAPATYNTIKTAYERLKQKTTTQA